jgi:hypothetical protein
MYKMKKMKNYFLAAMVSFMMLMPALTGTSATYANSNVTNVTLASFDWQAAAQLAISLWDMIEDAFCPETPQNRCKNGTCQSGACISFRESCGGGLNSGCGQSPDR